LVGCARQSGTIRQALTANRAHPRGNTPENSSEGSLPSKRLKEKSGVYNPRRSPATLTSCSQGVLHYQITLCLQKGSGRRSERPGRESDEHGRPSRHQQVKEEPAEDLPLGRRSREHDRVVEKPEGSPRDRRHRRRDHRDGPRSVERNLRPIMREASPADARWAMD
jgi:hypothetical protein